MNLSICLDQYASNYNLNALSSNGFSIYTNLDNFTTPIAQGIPYQNLFSPPIGNCPYLLTNVPVGATQLLVIDNCTSNPTLPGVTVPTSQELLIDCCYALIDVPQEPPPPFCVSCSLDFDVFSSSFVGQIIAGNLTSTCGPVTDYTIGWYKDGNYSSPEFISGYGNAFVPYQLTHPLAGNTAPYVTAGDWEGIIHDIAINGVTYSSVSGSGGGQPIPFESCFGTIVVAPLQCDNGTFPLPYTHQKDFTAIGNGATPPVIAATYELDSSTNYFAYNFAGNNVFDELEIKFISGDPNNTGNPSLYSQPIYLEKAQIGNDVANATIGNLQLIEDTTYPKKIKYSYYKKVLTLTNISRSANPSLPDRLDIKVTPNPNNNQTNWKLQMQCLDTFDCADCLNPFPAVKISDISLVNQCCGVIGPLITVSASCDGSDDIWDIQNAGGYTMGISYLAQNFPSPGNSLQTSFVPFSSNAVNGCSGAGFPTTYVCAPVTNPNSVISYHKSTTTVNGILQGIISMSFNNSADYLHYKNQLEAKENSLFNQLGPITFNSSLPEYYSGYQLIIPTTNIPCGDGVPFLQFTFLRSTYPNITYVENPANNYWSITIPLPGVTNGVPVASCNNCHSAADYHVFNVNQSAFNTPDVNVVNIYGSKLAAPFGSFFTQTYSSPASTTYSSTIQYERRMPYYSWNTLPFISSSNGWVNLPTLGGNPCPTLVSSSMPYTELGYTSWSNFGYYNAGWEAGFAIYFPNTTGSSDWFQLWTLVSSSNGQINNPYALTPGQMIYEYTASIGTAYSSSYFIDGLPTVTITPPPAGC
jgi:hypothetical protein